MSVFSFFSTWQFVLVVFSTDLLSHTCFMHIYFMINWVKNLWTCYMNLVHQVDASQRVPVHFYGDRHTPRGVLYLNGTKFRYDFWFHTIWLFFLEHIFVEFVLLSCNYNVKTCYPVFAQQLKSSFQERVLVPPIIYEYRYLYNL